MLFRNTIMFTDKLFVVFYSLLAQQLDATTAGVIGDPRDPREIPLNIIMELNQLKSVSELLSKFMVDIDSIYNYDLMDRYDNLAAVKSSEETETTLIRKRSLTSTVIQEIKTLSIPIKAGCSLENQTIYLKDTDDPSLYYYPSCTKVNRCGGCCSHDLLECQPTQEKTVHFEVIVSQFNGMRQFKFLGRKAIPIVQHLECKCGCIVKPEECKPLQTYHRDECRCLCHNANARDKCNEEYTIKLWNPENCTCQCREIHKCTTGYKFNFNTCRCEIYEE